VPKAPLPIKEFDDLTLLIRARQPLIVLQAEDPERVAVLIEYVCGCFGLPLFEWSPASGLRRKGGAGAVYNTQTLLGALGHVDASSVPAIYHLNLAGESLEDSRVIAKLLELRAEMAEQGEAIIVSAVEALPDELSRAFAMVTLSPPTREEYYQYVREILSDVRKRQKVVLQLSREEVHQLLSQLQGLTLMEVRRLLTASLVEHHALDARAIASVAEAKGKSVAQSSVLEYFPVRSGFEGLAGMTRLKAWLAQRALVFSDPQRATEFGLTSPRGLLLLGVQGCGKSACAQAVAASWTLPMLRLDAGRLYDKFVGATEHNLRRALETAERLAPVVLWVDEIEKALASGGDGDGGVSQRVLGTFLTWLAERKGNVFVVATANDISRLPAELLRKGRFDEIFFVDLPNPEIRAEILAIHLRQRGREPSALDLPALATLCEGFSGAELGQAVTSALFAAFHSGGELTQELLVRELIATKPLSVMMAERVQALRDWARDRTVSAD
jgi:hypothetical protein